MKSLKRSKPSKSGDNTRRVMEEITKAKQLDEWYEKNKDKLIDEEYNKNYRADVELLKNKLEKLLQSS